MVRKYVLEISVETVERAVAAERGGADRIELCADLAVGGLTPSQELLRRVREKVGIPIFSMIRPRAGDFVYSAAEFKQMKRDIADAGEARMDGMVLGILYKDRAVDVQRTQELVGLAGQLPVTFHRAFDECVDLRESLEGVIRTGAERILTSGGMPAAPEGAVVLAELIQLAGERITILPGVGINASNLADLVQSTCAREVHAGLSSALPYSSCDHRKFESEVRKLSVLLAQHR